MTISRNPTTIIATCLAASLTGCAAKKVDLTTLTQPPRPAELDAYDVFVGQWDWEAVMTDRNDARSEWTGTAEWHWTLDRRVLHGRLAARSGETEFEAAGNWSWHPRRGRYVWWMFNNWGYPQSGTARYDEHARAWRMDFKSVGLDGTTSYGRYRMSVIDENTLKWSLDEWADPLHLFRKFEMTGTYRRRGT